VLERDEHAVELGRPAQRDHYPERVARRLAQRGVGALGVEQLHDALQGVAQHQVALGRGQQPAR
jgi:hypothetical protein